MSERPGSGRNFPRLRVGVLARGLTLARWQREVLEHLLQGGDVDLVAVITDESGVHRPSLVQRLRSPRLLWNVYNNRWMAMWASAIERVDCSDLLAGLPRERITPVFVGRWSQHFSDDALRRVRAHELDVMIRFGFGILRGDVLESARHGIWSFHHDDERVVRGGPPSFWEVADGHPTTGVLLQRLTDRLDAGVPLARATFRTVGYSYPRNRDQAARGAAILPASVARAVRYGWLDPAHLPLAASDAPIRKDPTNRQMLRYLPAQAWRSVSSRARSIATGARWGIGIGRVEENPDAASPTSLDWLPERTRGYFADPFPFVRDGVEAVLVEDFDEPTARGVVSAMRRDESRWTRLPGVIDNGDHASYPFLVEADGDLFCVPESAKTGCVTAWRCLHFPDEWEAAHELIGAPVLDPTVVEWDGRWWLFGTLGGSTSNSALHVWSAPAFSGPWTAHPLNPVKIDVTSARPAGTPFVRDGVLHRPAQDCSESYGGGVVINRIDRLDLMGFSESVVDRLSVDSSPYDAGNHTLSIAAGLIAVDGKRRVFDAYRTRREIMARLRRN